MTWWQTSVAVWLGGWALLVTFLQLSRRREPTSHGQGIITMMGCLGFLWPVVVAWLPFAALWMAIGAIVDRLQRRRA